MCWLCVYRSRQFADEQVPEPDAAAGQYAGSQPVPRHDGVIAHAAAVPTAQSPDDVFDISARTPAETRQRGG